MSEQPGIPAWFKSRAGKTSEEKLARTCGMCGAPPGEKCRYVVAANSHRDPATGKYVDNVVGEQMVRHHKGR